MGRHAASSSTDSPGATTGAGPTSPSLRSRAVLAGAAAAAAAVVALWAGATWRVTLLAAGAAGVVVLVSALVAGTIPGPPTGVPEAHPTPGEPVQ